MSGSVGITALFDKYKDSADNDEILINEFSGMISMRNSNGDIISFSKSSRICQVTEFLEKIYHGQLIDNFDIYQCPIDPCLVNGNALDSINLNGILQSALITDISIFLDIISRDASGNYDVPINVGQTMTLHFLGQNSVDIPITLNVNNFSSIGITNWKAITTEATRKINSINLWTSDTPKDVLVGLYIVALTEPAKGINTNQVITV